MKYFLILLFSAMLLSGCMQSVERLSAEDIEVLTIYKPELMVLQSALPSNSREKYEAARKLNKSVDFSFIRDVATLDKIFSARDARVDVPNSRTQMLMFYYQYMNKSIRFCFYRHDDVITKVEVIER